MLFIAIGLFALIIDLTYFQHFCLQKLEFVFIDSNLNPLITDTKNFYGCFYFFRELPWKKIDL